MLTIDHLEKRFGSTVLFRDLTFTVDGPAVLWPPAAGQDHPSAHPHGAGNAHGRPGAGRRAGECGVPGGPALPPA